jgi:hypothetical protein
MSTKTTDLVPMVNREVNPPGLELFDGASNSDLVGYIEDAFWDARLSGLLDGWTIIAGSSFATPVAGNYITDSSTQLEDFPYDYRMLVVLFAGIRILRLKILNLAVNFKAVAGPTEYEQQASATTLRAVLDSMQGRIQELKVQYSDAFSGPAMALFDGELQREYSILNNLPAYTVG